VSSLGRYLTGWQPQPLTATDALPPEPACALASVLETPEDLVPREVLPPLWHWVYFLDWPPHSALGQDGHPTHGRFLPPIPDRRRMFAGGRLTVTQPLQLGRPAERTSWLADVEVKHGRSGEMALVTVHSEYRQGGELRVAEEQDYAYRCGESSTNKSSVERPRRLPESSAAWQQAFTGDPVRLFRFSALTANAHRIHYDAPYARDVESYPGLVVHGPLLALLMTELARHRCETTVSTVDYRLRRPVFAGDPVLVTGTPQDEAADLAVLADTDVVMAQARVGFV
jgi:3-methylfumaryl-CoA hydratase